MEHRRHSWIVRCILICMALACWNSADGLAPEDTCEVASYVGDMEPSSTFVDTNGFCIAPSELVCHSCCSASARTVTKVPKQHSAKHSWWSLALFRGSMAVNDHTISLYFKYLEYFSIGQEESKPLFLCLRKLIL